MLYVLADEHGTYYGHETEDGWAVGNTGKTNLDFALASAMGTDINTDPFHARPSGALVVVFKTPADGYRFIKMFSLGEATPSRRFNPRPARPDDELGETVCFVEWSGEEPKFIPTPTPDDAYGEVATA